MITLLPHTTEYANPAVQSDAADQNSLSYNQRAQFKNVFSTESVMYVLLPLRHKSAKSAKKFTHKDTNNKDK